MVSHGAVASNSEARTRIAPAIPALSEFLERGVLCGNVDLDRHQLIAALPIPARETSALEAKHFPRTGALRNGEHHRPFGGRNLHLRAEHRFLERNRKLEAD